MIDVTLCKDLIPELYLTTHDYEDLKEGETGVIKNRYFMKDGRIPLDLAFCRWIAVTRGVVMMPCSLMYHKDSTYKEDKWIRVAICKGMESSVEAVKRLKRV